MNFKFCRLKAKMILHNFPVPFLFYLNGKEHIAHLRQDCRNSKFGIFELLV